MESLENKLTQNPRPLTLAALTALLVSCGVTQESQTVDILPPLSKHTLENVRKVTSEEYEKFLPKLQFYTDKKLEAHTTEPVDTTLEISTTKGKLKETSTINSKDALTIPEGQKCSVIGIVYTSDNKMVLLVAFEENATLENGLYLGFMLDKNNTFTLAVLSKESGNTTIKTITYGEKIYEIIKGSGMQLKFMPEVIKKEKPSKHIITKGRGYKKEGSPNNDAKHINYKRNRHQNR